MQFKFDSIACGVNVSHGYSRSVQRRKRNARDPQTHSNYLKILNTFNITLWPAFSFPLFFGLRLSFYSIRNSLILANKQLRPLKPFLLFMRDPADSRTELRAIWHSMYAQRTYRLRNFNFVINVSTIPLVASFVF